MLLTKSRSAIFPEDGQGSQSFSPRHLARPLPPPGSKTWQTDSRTPKRSDSIRVFQFGARKGQLVLLLPRAICRLSRVFSEILQDRHRPPGQSADRLMRILSSAKRLFLNDHLGTALIGIRSNHRKECSGDGKFPARTSSQYRSTAWTMSGPRSAYCLTKRGFKSSKRPSMS